MVFDSRESITKVQCIIPINKSYFYSKLDSLTIIQTFRYNWPELALIRAE